ncbi:hypothetical protein MHAS44199_22695 [Mycolicibacterium hassiacum DSM 44199]|nr:hypothetical protein [Mycolicibacterium hassiacum DSM 44199]
MPTPTVRMWPSTTATWPPFSTNDIGIPSTMAPGEASDGDRGDDDRPPLPIIPLP